MRRLSMALLLALALGLAACSPSREQVACEASGGTYESYVAGYTITYIWVGKVMVPQQTPIIMYRCSGDPS